MNRIPSRSRWQELFLVCIFPGVPLLPEESAYPRMVLLIPSFCVAYLAGVFGLIWFGLHVLGVGDPKFKTAVGFYFRLWSAGYSPVVIAALLFLWRSRQLGWYLWCQAGVYLLLILVTLGISFVLDIDWKVLLLEFVMLALLFRKIERVFDRGVYKMLE